jgi:hypothetical protein
MPKRIIDGERTWRSKKLRQVQPVKYRPEYTWVFPIANDVATFECDHEAIWGRCYATNRPDVTLEDVEEILDEFERVKLLFRWKIGDQTWGYWTGTDKPGLLPPPSKQYSEDPAPPADKLKEFMGLTLPYRVGTATVTDGGPGIGTSSGLGIGSCNGTGGDGSVAGGSSIHNSNSREKPQNQFGIADNPTLTTVAVLQHMQFMTGEIIPANDPIVPLLTAMAQEHLALHQGQPLTLYNVKTEQERIVQPGDPDYPGPDGNCLEEDDQPGLSLREAATIAAFSSYVFACEIITGLRQYLPIEDSEESLHTVLKMMGWPNANSELSVAWVHAVAHWAFKKSNYWKDRVKTVEQFCESFAQVRSQYDKYYARLPEGKKPHQMGMGRPVRENA